MLRAFSLNTHDVEPPLGAAIKARGEQTAITLADALGLIHAYQVAEAYRAFSDIVDPLVAADDQRRYVIETNVQVPVGDGATVCAMIWRPRTGPARLPALLQFTIYADTDAPLRRPAAQRVERLCRRHRLHPRQGVQPRRDRPVRARRRRRGGADRAGSPPAVERRPGRHVRRQLLGDVALGRGQAQAAGAQGDHGRRAGGARRGRARWKATSSGTSCIPGRSTPPTTRRSTTRPTTTRRAGAGSTTRWYVSGRAYRDLDKIDGTPNPVWDDWLAHPSYDAYWQAHDPVRARVRRASRSPCCRRRATTSAGRAPRSTTSPSTTSTTRAPSTTC